MSQHLEFPPRNQADRADADSAVRFGRCFGNSAQFWLDLQGQYDIAAVERDKGAEIARTV